MGMVGRICTRNILTAGHVPLIKNKKEKDIVQGISNPSFGFVNALHIDKLDMLNKAQVAAWKETAKENKWNACSRLLEMPGFCLPTTCGY
jgi:hypothetical protein